MKKQITALLFVTSTALSPAFADENEGQKLIDKSCQQCHDNGIYSRSNSIIQSFPELQARVEFCESAAKPHWSDKQHNHAIEYLNNTYYNFSK